MRRIISIISAGLLLCSCIYEDLNGCPNFNGKGEDSTAVTKAVPVEFVISTTDTTETRSSITVSDTKVADINIYAYYDANGNRRQHTTGTSFSHNVSWKP